MRQIVELLRIETPVSLVLRYATEDMLIHDDEIAKGDLVMLMLAAANNDDREFDDPLHTPGRPQQHPPLGFRRRRAHRCLGSHLARPGTFDCA